jgi:hypothetical protein
MPWSLALRSPAFVRVGIHLAGSELAVNGALQCGKLPGESVKSIAAP